MALYLPASLRKREQEEETHRGLTTHSGPSRENRLHRLDNLQSRLTRVVTRSETIRDVRLMQSGATCVHLQIGVAAIKDRFDKMLEALFRNLRSSINAILSSVIGRIVAPGTHRTDLGYLHLVIIRFSREREGIRFAPGRSVQCSYCGLAHDRRLAANRGQASILL
jgi:hypothetical protein